jgi:hypothetical protein
MNAPIPDHGRSILYQSNTCQVPLGARNDDVNGKNETLHVLVPRHVLNLVLNIPFSSVTSEEVKYNGNTMRDLHHYALSPSLLAALLPPARRAPPDLLPLLLPTPPLSWKEPGAELVLAGFDPSVVLMRLGAAPFNWDFF